MECSTTSSKFNQYVGVLSICFRLSWSMLILMLSAVPWLQVLVSQRSGVGLMIFPFKYKRHIFGVYRFTFFPLIGASKYVSGSVSSSLIVGGRKKTAETYYREQVTDNSCAYNIRIQVWLLSFLLLVLRVFRVVKQIVCDSN